MNAPVNHLLTKRALTRRMFLGSTALGSLALLSGCGSSKKSPEENARIKVVCSFYPMYDFTKKIAGDHAEVELLIPSGVEPHDWEPSPTDIRKLQDADLFVYNGAGMEPWVYDMLASLKDKAPRVSVEASKDIELLNLDEEDEHDHDEDHDHEEHEHDHDHEGHDHEDHHHDHGGIDPHVWLSPVKAQEQVNRIAKALKAADPTHGADYDAQAQKIIADLNALHHEYETRTKKLSQKLLVVSHKAFGYICTLYGLEQVALSGLNAEGGPNLKTLAAITELVREKGVTTIFSEELVSPKIAETIARETNTRVKVLNPLEGLTEEQIKAGEDYFSVMRSNLDKICTALA